MKVALPVRRLPGGRVRVGHVEPTKAPERFTFPVVPDTEVAKGRQVKSIDLSLTAEINMTPLVPLIRCTFVVPCGVCWYCKQASGWQGWYRP